MKKIIKHLDLFSGIGGFAYAVDQVWEAEHIFVENDKFCQAVLRKHYPNSEIYGDIRQFTTDTRRERQEEQKKQTTRGEQCNSKHKTPHEGEFYDTHAGTIEKQCINIITGGFPCQPFSQAGRRKGTADDRFLWPEMLRCIREFKPTWVIAENVRGLLSIEGGLVFEQVCADLENIGYEVQPFIIPAVAVNAPHRRDRVWIVANR
ncbi:MAG: DNA (cytosine-5-)-methyltransferase, partial [Candidatus Yonathbacteria bacterium]|nr:DNA (cytosine-5-)-methyltransferase [Candidatus Yonathbacteria bacterium]